jgi:hypothetical protein
MFTPQPPEQIQVVGQPLIFLIIYDLVTVENLTHPPSLGRQAWTVEHYRSSSSSDLSCKASVSNSSIVRCFSRSWMSNRPSRSTKALKG